MGQGFTPGYKEAKLDKIKKTVAVPMQELAYQIEGDVIPPRG
jgi:hypothetical protein